MTRCLGSLGCSCNPPATCDGLSALMLRIATWFSHFQSLSSAQSTTVGLVFLQGNRSSTKDEHHCSSTIFLSLRPAVRSSLSSIFLDWNHFIAYFRVDCCFVILTCDSNLRDCFFIPVSKFASRCGPFLRSYSPSSNPSFQRYRSNTTSQITTVDRILLRRNVFGFLVR